MTRLPLPEPHGQLLIWDHNAKPNDPVRYRDIFTADQMHAYSDAENAALREQVRVLREALEYVLLDEPTGIPRASSACRRVVALALLELTK